MIIDCAPNGDRATFSDDRRFQYHLYRRLHDRCERGPLGNPCMLDHGHDGDHYIERDVGRVALFILFAPPLTDPFYDDPVTMNCMIRARHWDYDSISIVNLFALRCAGPEDLRHATARGDDSANDDRILAAVRCTPLVVCAWGSDGWIGKRGAAVVGMLRKSRVPLHHLGMTAHGQPKHPIAKGRHSVPAGQRPIRWMK